MKEILDIIKAALEEAMGESYSISHQEMQKQNDTVLHGVVIRRGNEWAAPMIPIDYMASAVQKGSSSVTDVVQEIIHIYKESRLTNVLDGANIILNRQDILKSVVYGVVSLEKNTAYLVDKVFREFLDLAVMYRVVVHTDNEGIHTIAVTNEMCQEYSICLEELEEAARNNTKAFGFCLRPVAKVLAELCGEDSILGDGIPMWVCSNERGTLGAHVLLYGEVFAELAKMLGDDLVILPSSIHEVIAFAASQVETPNDLTDLVNFVNTSSVPEGDVLSDSVYQYSRETGEISMVQGS